MKIKSIGKKSFCIRLSMESYVFCLAMKKMTQNVTIILKTKYWKNRKQVTMKRNQHTPVNYPNAKKFFEREIEESERRKVRKNI